MGNDRVLEQNDSTFLWTLSLLVILFILMIFAVDKAYAGGGYGNHGGGMGHTRSYRGGGRHYSGHRYNRGGYGYRRSYGGYGHNGWNDLGYGLATGVGVGLGVGIVNLITTPRYTNNVYYDNNPRVILQRPVIIERPAPVVIQKSNKTIYITDRDNVVQKINGKYYTHHPPIWEH